MHTSTSNRADRTAYPFHVSTPATFARPVRSNRRTVRRIPVLRLAAQLALACAAFAALAHYF